MSIISNDGKEQIKIIKNALDSMYDKLDKVVYTKVKHTKNEDVNKKPTKQFNYVREEFEAIAGIVALTDHWKEV